MPIGIIQFWMISSIVIPRPPGFGPEHRMMRYGLRGQNSVLKLPGALKLVKVFGREMVKVFLQHAQQIKPAGEQRFVSQIVGADTADVFVHDLLKTLKAIERQDIAGRNGSGDNLISANLVILQGLENCLFRSSYCFSLT